MNILLCFEYFISVLKEIKNKKLKKQTNMKAKNIPDKSTTNIFNDVTQGHIVLSPSTSSSSLIH